ncbi:50S ribosomal protein L4 [Blattabacterium sp. (Cryptocercus kyebangensis)]|uniref:50S ribosomal protein L4 n=1 Tax=Blattabacterium sp. (Cryptocercus kyebangensis) TaxID=298656 RepID=UPI000D7CCFD8|nr:50S ribosomal protein L4 [Blattabacterium sp. (Cryptocercus kyebangensis)]AWU43676.1 50S ribosomal protein L4 [Blattabacterium sp. (Cryptocercus kyebangensis)]
MELKILDIKGNYTTRKIEFNENFFGKKSYDHSIYLEMKRYLSAQRQGTHKSKERGDLSGSTRKLHRQKGTGGSRKGDIKNPIFRGGGRIFGPRPRRYFEKINKLTKNLVKKTIIGYKLKENKIKIIEDFQFEVPKTKLILKILKSLELENKKSLMIIGKPNKNLYLSSRNLKNFKLLNINELDSYSLLNSLYVIFSENSMDKIHELLNN